ncbi:MAG: hypothetical protein IKK63_03330 [Clostridia bacterium]|nr:hypothetical protein [Clostridia bacterium]
MKLTKRILSLLMAMLMLCSGMAITASAAGETYTLTADNCYVDIENVEIFVKAATVEIDGEEYAVVFSATQADDATKELRALQDTKGNTVFTNPVTGKSYKIQGTVTVAEKETLVTNTFTVAVLNAKNAPAAPIAKKITASSIEISSVSGCEYRIKVDGEWKEWQKSNAFTGLDAETAYAIEMRYAKTATHYASPASLITVKTLKAADPAYVPDLIKLTNKTESTLVVAAYKKNVDENGKVTYTEVKDVEFSIDGGKTWQETNEFKGLKADSTYSVIARYVYDELVQEANVATAPAAFITNARAAYPADIKKCTVSASDGDNYANESIKLTVNADTAPDKYDAQYGDTKYVPVHYTITGSTEPLYFNPSKDGKVYTSDFTPGESNANKEITVTVYFQKFKCRGEDDKGKTYWIAEGEPEVKTCKVKVGEVHNFFTDVKNFFLGIFNFLFNDLPAKINDLIGEFDITGMVEGLAGLTEMLGGLDLGGLMGE